MESPAQPALSEWKFVDELKQPLHGPIRWERKVPPEGAADWSGGVALTCRFPDSRGVLETATRDFQAFLKAGQIGQGPYPITIEQAPTECFEAYRIEIAAAGCRVAANDSEGIRRAFVRGLYRSPTGRAGLPLCGGGNGRGLGSAGRSRRLARLA